MKFSPKLYISIIAFMIAASALYLSTANRLEPEHVHYHAGFKVYVDNQLQDYSGYQYMNYTPCAEHNEKKSKEEEQIEKAHLHDNVGDVVHVHRAGALWGDLFSNSNIELPNEKILEGYIDGVKQDNILTSPIEPYTTAIFMLGENMPELGKALISKEYIVEIEKRSELCGN